MLRLCCVLPRVTDFCTMMVVFVYLCCLMFKQGQLTLNLVKWLSLASIGITPRCTQSLTRIDLHKSPISRRKLKKFQERSWIHVRRHWNGKFATGYNPNVSKEKTFVYLSFIIEIQQMLCLCMYSNQDIKSILKKLHWFKKNGVCEESPLKMNRGWDFWLGVAGLASSLAFFYLSCYPEVSLGVSVLPVA